MRRSRFACLLATSLLLATRVEAQAPFTTALLLAVPVQPPTPFTFTSGGTVTAYGYYVGNYSGLMGTTKVTLNCVDFFHDVYVGQTWNANLTNLGTATTGYTTRFADLTLYREAAWLTTQYAGKSDPEIGVIQATIWNLFGTTPAGIDGSSYWLDQAKANYATMNFSDVYVVTDVYKSDPHSVQEFVMVTTPEPATLVLFGTGLTSVIGVGLRRRKRGLDAA